MMYCDNYACTMSEQACKINQGVAQEAITAILDDGESIFTLEEYQINRMIVCGKCDQSSVDPARAKKALRSSISTLMEKIERYDEWGTNPEVAHDKMIETKRRYRDREGETIREQAEVRSMDQRLEQLRKEMKR